MGRRLFCGSHYGLISWGLALLPVQEGGWHREHHPLAGAIRTRPRISFEILQTQWNSHTHFFFILLLFISIEHSTTTSSIIIITNMKTLATLSILLLAMFAFACADKTTWTPIDQSHFVSSSCLPRLSLSLFLRHACMHTFFPPSQTKYSTLSALPSPLTPL